jgi:hypothetical protein
MELSPLQAVTLDQKYAKAQIHLRRAVLIARKCLEKDRRCRTTPDGREAILRNFPLVNKIAPQAPNTWDFS